MTLSRAIPRDPFSHIQPLPQQNRKNNFLGSLGNSVGDAQRAYISIQLVNVDHVAGFRGLNLVCPIKVA
jgi:hypothetical protein